MSLERKHQRDMRQILHLWKTKLATLTDAKMCVIFPLLLSNERKRQTDRQTGTETETETETETARNRETGRDRERQRYRETDRETD